MLRWVSPFKLSVIRVGLRVTFIVHGANDPKISPKIQSPKIGMSCLRFGRHSKFLSPRGSQFLSFPGQTWFNITGTIFTNYQSFSPCEPLADCGHAFIDMRLTGRYSSILELEARKHVTEQNTLLTQQSCRFLPRRHCTK